MESKTIEEIKKEILNKAIAEYNAKVNDLSKFKLNDRELNMFSDCMEAYASQQVELAVDKALEVASKRVGFMRMGGRLASAVILSIKPQIMEELRNG